MVATSNSISPKKSVSPIVLIETIILTVVINTKNIVIIDILDIFIQTNINKYKNRNKIIKKD